MSLFSFKKATDAIPFEKLASWRSFFEQTTEKLPIFFETLEFVAKFMQAENASLYIYDKKAESFLLKKWTGSRPQRLSFSSDFEFLRFVQKRKNPVFRREFSETHELRQSALYFFQQTACDLTFPILEGEDWVGLLNFDLRDVANPDLYLPFISLYAREIRQILIREFLQEKVQKLSEVGEIKNQLLSNVTHELQTPLNGILGFTEALLDPDFDLQSPDAKFLIQTIRKSGVELKNTVENLLKLTQIQAKKDELRFQKASIYSLIREVVDLFEPMFLEKSLTIEMAAEEKNFDVFVEPDQIRSVLVNLFSNALKFTEKGSVKIECKKNGEMLHVILTDTGIGIDAAKLDLIFEEFYQADGSHTRSYGGTGIGLAIVKKIISLHGGRVWAESILGKGTRVTFTVPLVPG